MLTVNTPKTSREPSLEKEANQALFLMTLFVGDTETSVFENFIVTDLLLSMLQPSSQRLKRKFPKKKSNNETSFFFDYK